MQFFLYQNSLHSRAANSSVFNYTGYKTLPSVFLAFKKKVGDIVLTIKLLKETLIKWRSSI